MRYFLSRFFTRILVLFAAVFLFAGSASLVYAANATPTDITSPTYLLPFDPNSGPASNNGFSLPVASFQRNFGTGSRGADVELLQRFLVSAGYLNLPPGVGYGYYGALTQGAVVNFQRANSIFPASGFVGPLTRGFLNGAAGGSVQTTGVLFPRENDVVVSPLRVAGVVNSSQWQCVNGVVGQATLFDARGSQLAQTNLVASSGCTQIPYAFEGMLTFATPGTQAGYLTIQGNGVTNIAVQRINVRFIPDPSAGAPVFTAPIGGERIVQKSSYTVRWTGGPSKVGLQLIDVRREQGFSALNPVVWSSGGFDNTGSYSFVVPETLNGLYRFAMTDGSTAVIGRSNSFSIINGASSNGSVAITAPAQGTVWQLNSVQTISWTGDIPKAPVLNSPCEDKTLSVVDPVSGKRYPVAVLDAALIDAHAYTNWSVGFSVSSLCVDKPFVVKIPAGNYQVELAWYERTNEGLLFRRKATGGVFTISGQQASGVTVTSPSAGVNWIAGSSYEVRWQTGTTPDVASTATITLVPPRPACLDSVPACAIAQIAPYVIADSVANTGSYKWVIPSNIPDVYKGTVRVQVVLNTLNISGTSDPFILSSTPVTSKAITLLSPVGGEQWSVGSGQTIKWKADTSISAVDIALFTSGGVCIAFPCNIPPVFVKTIGTSVPNTGSYTWTVPGDLSTAKQYFVRVSNAAAPSQSDISPSPFSIVSSGISVYLDQKFLLKSGQTATVSDFKNMQITVKEIVPVACTQSILPSCAYIATLSVYSTGEGTQLITLSPEASQSVFGAKISLLALDGPGGTATLLVRRETVPTGSVAVAYPNGGESLVSGLTSFLRWKADASFATVTISVVAQTGCLGGPTGNNCPTTSFVLANNVANTGSYAWTVGRDSNGASIPTGSYLLKVTASTGVSDVSDAPFTVVSSAVNASVQVTAPNGGETLQVGNGISLQTVSWIASPYANSWIALFLVPANGQSQLIAQRIEPGQGSYAWSIPASTVSGKYKIEARLYTGPSLCVSTICPDVLPPTLLASDASNDYFVITSTSSSGTPITLSTPSTLSGVVGSYFQAVFDASGGAVGSYTFAISSGALPPGLTFGRIIPSCAPPAPGIIASCPAITSALLSGTPTQAGSFTFEIVVTDTAGATARQQFTMTVAPATVAATSCNQQLVIPAYFYPGSFWDQAVNSRTSAGVMIMNPASGPGASVDQNYVAAVLRAQQAGIKVLGYVHTSYGARPAATVKAEINTFKQWYNVDGIFLDEGATSATALPYYQDIQSYIRTNMPGKLIMINPGVVPDQGYMGVADVVMIFEDTYAMYKTWTPPAWVNNYAPNRFAHLVHATFSETDMKDAANLAFKRRGGYVYITNDLLPNPWDSLPPYFSSEVAQLSGSGCSIASTSEVKPVTTTASALDTLWALVTQLQKLVQ